MFMPYNLNLVNELLVAIHFFNKKGWSPATSTNYSVRTQNPEEIIISRSGGDKGQFTMNDFLFVNLKGEILPPFEHYKIKPSAETEIHTAIYKRFPDINCVLHTHSVLGTVLSLKNFKEKQLTFNGLEILKGLEGNLTHETTEILPIVSNSQSMHDIIQEVNHHFENLPIHGFLIAGHGLYTWGKDIETAKRQVETFEFLLECNHAMRDF